MLLLLVVPILTSFPPPAPAPCFMTRVLRIWLYKRGLGPLFLSQTQPSIQDEF